jgi:hypothetical protein
VLKGRKLLGGLIVAAVVALAFVYGQVSVAVDSIRFDLNKICSSIYEAHSKRGKWPMKISDLEGTEYLSMPYRKWGLETGVMVVIWQEDLDPNPAANRDRILAYNNGGILPRLGLIWACRGDLRVERIRREEIPKQGK